MTTRTQAILKTTGAALVLIAAAAFAVSRLHHVTGGAEDRLKIWFYDESEQRLYAVPRDTLPPHRGTGGPGNDGVKAIVVAPAAGAADPSQRRIAYLETYTPELKNLLEEVRAAEAAGRPCAQPIPSGESDFYQKNTLVRRATDTQWFASASPEAQTIMKEWRGWRAPDGSALIVCVP